MNSPGFRILRAACGPGRAFAAALLAAGMAWPGPAAASETVRIGLPPWDGARVKSAVFAELAEILGYRAEYVEAAAPLVFQEMARGRVDLNLSAWVPGQEGAFGPFLEDGRIRVVGENLKGARTGLAVPRALAGRGLDSLERLEAFAEVLDSTIHCIEPGSGANAVLEAAIEAGLYGLDGWTMIPSSTQAMLAQVQRAVRRDEPVVFCAWAPHWMNIAIDLVYLADPAGHWGGPGQTRVLTLARAGLAGDAPELWRLLERFRIDAQTQSRWIHDHVRKQRPAKAVARDWLTAHPERVSAWLEGLQTTGGGDAVAAYRERFSPLDQ